MASKTRKILLLPGDGIGPEVLDFGLRLIYKIQDIFGINIKIEHDLIGGACWDKFQVFCKNGTVEKAKNQSSKVSKLIFKTSKKEKVETNDSSLDSENQQKTKKVGSALKGFQSSGAKLISDLKWIENPMLSSK